MKTSRCSIGIIFLVLLLCTTCTKDEEEKNFPSCKISNPSEGDIILQGQLITISVDADDADRNIDEVFFYIAGHRTISVKNSPYNHSWNTTDVPFGNQMWMAENLASTKFNDGTDIPNVMDEHDWEANTTPAYCWYDNDEWTILIDYLGGESIAGGKLRETGTSHWPDLNTVPTNESCFSALPGGYRAYIDNLMYNGLYFEGLGFIENWWTSSEYSSTEAGILVLFGNEPEIARFYSTKQNRISVRCVKD